MSTPTSANGNLPARLSPGRKYEILDPEVNGVFAAHGFPLDIVERKQVIRAFILDAQYAIALLPQCEPPVIHHFAPGVYMREIRMPRGSLIIGKIHRHAHFNLIPSGDLSVLTESGPRRIVAPYSFVSDPGTKRCGFMHADTTWITVHANPTDERDLAVLEREILLDDFMPLFRDGLERDTI